MSQETSRLLGDEATRPRYSNGGAHDTEEASSAKSSPRHLPSILLPMAIGIFLGAMDQTIVVSLFPWKSTHLYQTAIRENETCSDIFGRKTCLLFAYTIVVSIIMSDIVPLRSRGTWQGILNIIYASGSAMGAPLGGFLADTIGWRWAFLAQVPIIVLAFISVSVALHLPTRDAPSALKTKLKRVDFPGALSLILCVFSLLFGLDRGGNMAWDDNYTIAAVCLFVSFFVLFTSIELGWAAEPFAPGRIIANPALIGAYMVNFFGLMSAFSMIFHVSLFYQAVLGKSASEVGFWLIPSVCSGVVGSLFGGLVIQASGRYYWITVAAYVTMVMGMLLTVFEAGVVEKSAVGVAMGRSTSHCGKCTNFLHSLIALISNAGPADQAMATAGSYLFRSLGSVVGLSIGSTLLQTSLRSSLREKLTHVDLDIDEIVRRVRESLTYIDQLDPEVAAVVRAADESAVLVTMWFSAAMAGCALVSAVFIRETRIGGRK
ncbi:member of the major facilitator superfamily [Roridomyces roridus]|uniref:Member of the major facilitator superfamily n=1 Tax=Roridomyces roridus TaxID=1738132 RepID=A0AAD7FCY7_9AGAR|nr:member of the major facilitator superfamily [Roridomyces roridus]